MLFSRDNVQDFPIRGHKVYLHIRRRRWLNTKTNKVAYRDWTNVAEGTRITEGFEFLLKESVDTNPKSAEAVRGFYGVKGKTLQRN